MQTLYSSEQTIVNQLVDTGLFSAMTNPATSQRLQQAHLALQRPQTQRRVVNYLTALLGEAPAVYQGNLLLLLGANRVPATQVHVLLATLKAVINLPELQAATLDRAIPVLTIVRLVHSEVPDLDEKTIRQDIKHLFVDRFGLFKADQPLQSTDEGAVEVEEYWDVAPSFVYVAQCLVNELLQQRDTPTLTARQRVNRGLLRYRYLSPATTPQLWPLLQANQVELAADWAPLQRFDLECGAGYALLLDRQRQPSTARPFAVAIQVAQKLGTGLPLAELNALIHQVAQQLFPKVTISVSEVKKALTDFALATQRDGFMRATPLSQRFVVQAESEGESCH
ncbi:hypothetical protein [Loigolactobacillus bifermentans]|uniref:Uncharacterized protein n=1 Tax=Loigolactobacillus bifermentans DSM 20003 TaxID=1423726 RepID=A0A0R1H2D3_9LACO|nr:hypothetical protein [Loigolactobacillus bifermentans]KRK40597.1 hypothetical protein FC07_GL000005 [Loigolactobacillus bifermentans DSM 20003]QGG60720.1 hypothetical protein LB003_09765 [Loigolactobacillus bifermentans]